MDRKDGVDRPAETCRETLLELLYDGHAPTGSQIEMLLDRVERMEPPRSDRQEPPPAAAPALRLVSRTEGSR